MSNVVDRTRILRIVAFALLAAGSAAGGAERTVRLAVTASVHGELSTCGCRSGPQGGLARRSARIAAMRAETPDVLLLDAGGYASLDPAVGRLLTDSLSVYMTDEGYDAVAVGDEEIASGVPFGPAGVRPRPPLVSANLFRQVDDRLEPLVRPWVMMESGGVEVGVTSVVSPALVGRIETRLADLFVTDPTEAARRALAEMRAAGAELTVLLAHVNESDARALGRALDVDVIVIGHDPRPRVDHGVADGAVFVHSGTRGRYLADVTLVLDADGLATVRGRTTGIEIDDPIDIDVQRWTQSALSDADAERRRLLVASREVSSPVRGYAGADACGACHREVYASWAETPHARAFETLEAVGMSHASDCVTCHVTGPVDGALRGEAGNVDRRGVQCEACHLVPDVHPGGSTVPSVEPVACRRCHDAENSPAYDPESYWRRILHPASGG